MKDFLASDVTVLRDRSVYLSLDRKMGEKTIDLLLSPGQKQKPNPVLLAEKKRNPF